MGGGQKIILEGHLPPLPPPPLAPPLQFSNTKWAKVPLINYILDKLQENMGNIFILCSLSWIK